MSKDLPAEWFTEKYFHQTVGTSFKVKKVLHCEQSPFQKIEVLETEGVGRLLLLDGKTMVSDRDEFVYHEVMGHVSYAVSRKTENVLIVGGGDGGIVREFVKHSSIKRIDLVEIDERVIAVSKEFFPGCTTGLSDPRVRVLPQDGVQFVENHKNEYDIIIMDSTDPEGFAEGLFTQKFYRSVFEALHPEGLMMAQTENPFYDEYGIRTFYDNLRAVFPVVESLTAPMLIYPGVFWTFAFASKKYRGTDLCKDKLQEMKMLEQKLKWYNTNWHESAFKLSNLHKNVTGC